MNIVGFLFLSYLVISYILGAIISMFIILENRDPARTVTWLLIFILLPGVGLLIYAVFGRNIRKRKLFKTQQMATNIREKKLFENLQKIQELVQLEKNSIQEKDTDDDEVDDHIKKRVINTLLNVGNFPYTINNKIDVYVDGNEKFENLINDIEKAQSHIHLEYFIIKDSEIGRKIKDLLIKKAKEGVKVRILYDDVGCWRFWFNRKFFNEMKAFGIEIKSFLPAKFPFIASQLNYRNHRKIVVIDGKIGYTGGINIGDEYIGRNKKFGYWRDTHIRIQGTAVYMLEMVFLIDWYYTTKDVIVLKDYFSVEEYYGNSVMQIITSGPDNDWESIHYAYFSAISQAKERIYIETPYFIPDESILRALKNAALSGIDVKIIFPKIADHKIVNSASYSYFDDILKAGGEVYLYTKGFLHSKIMIIDDNIASTGSTNMDLRSFMINFEINAFIYDKKIVNSMVEDFYEDLKCSEEIIHSKFKDRSVYIKIKESIARLFSPIL